MTVAFIPIRKGSKSIPDKNIKDLCGKPLFYWVTKAAYSSGVDKVVLSTDSHEYADLAIKFFPDIEIHSRSEEVSTDEATTESVMLEYIEFSGLSDDDVFILLQATSPLTISEDIKGALSKYRKKEFSSLLSVVESKRFTWAQNDSGEFEPQNYNPQSRPRRQEFFPEYIENGAIYINSIGNIKKDKCRLSGPSYGSYVMSEDTYVEIDEPSDWELVESKIKSKAKGRTIYIDIDETICNSKSKHYSDATPIREAIAKANELYDSGYTIVYWTARGTVTGIDWTDVTKFQLERWGAKYHELKMGKPAYDLFIDDKNMNSKDWWNNIDDFLKDIE